ncbi:cation:proton antiporter domain-containing protein [Actinoplanes philippinensis]|uniref:cation:proton antiporter domain-containing protein n=1 Tax=Actinoplanes philippinensis TaxID=35752 RepID=UPI0033DBE2EE
MPGAVLAPPDTITTVSPGHEIGPPRRATSILTGVSLVNDATALTLFTIAVAAVNGAHTTWQGGLRDLVRAASIGLGTGAAYALAGLIIRERLGNPAPETSLVPLLLPFTTFLTAEQVHASGILAERLPAVGRTVTAGAVAEPDPDAAFEAQRLALGRAVHDQRLSEDVARELIEGIDLRQAARHTIPT